MSPQEKLRRHILTNQSGNPTGSIYYQPITLAGDFSLQEDHVRQILDEMESEGLITLEPNGNYIAIRVTARGDELLSGISASPIGFK